MKKLFFISSLVLAGFCLNSCERDEEDNNCVENAQQKVDIMMTAYNKFIANQNYSNCSDLKQKWFIAVEAMENCHNFDATYLNPIKQQMRDLDCGVFP